MESFIWGIPLVSYLSLPTVLGGAAPLGGGVTFGLGAQDWCHTLGSLPYSLVNLKICERKQSCTRWTMQMERVGRLRALMGTSAG